MDIVNALKNTFGLILLIISTFMVGVLISLFPSSWTANLFLYLLVPVAWLDFISLRVSPTLAILGISGYLFGCMGSVPYALPSMAVFFIFAFLVSENREKLASRILPVSVLIMVLNSYYFPKASVIVWALLGLMVGIMENVVIEEMCGGDIPIMTLFFMALGPLAVIPLAFQYVTGPVLFQRETGYPVAPAMFVIAVPVAILMSYLLNWHVLPDWLFHGFYNGSAISGPLAFLGGLIGVLAYWKTLVEPDLYELVSSVNVKDNAVAVTTPMMSIIMGVTLSLLIFTIGGYPGYYLLNHGHKILGLAVLLITGMFGVFMILIGSVFEWHYSEKSSIDQFKWIFGLLIMGSLLTVPLLVLTGRVIVSAMGLRFLLGGGLAMAVLTTLDTIFFEGGVLVWNPGRGAMVDKVWKFVIVLSSFLAGVLLAIGLNAATLMPG